MLRVPDEECSTAYPVFVADPPVQLPIIVVAEPALLRVTQFVVPATIAAVIVTPGVAINPPPAVPPVAAVVIVAQVNDTLIVIDVFPLATSTSPAASEAHVSQLPLPFAASFHWLTESMLTVEFCANHVVISHLDQVSIDCGLDRR
jgi:hypothetical protein